MKKVLLLLLIVSLCLSGCSAKENTAPHSHEDLTIRIPTDYIDLSGETFEEDLDFVFGKEPVVINGMRDAKETFAAYGLELDLQTYGELLMEVNQVSSQLTQKDGIWNFSYTSGDFTYVVTLWETESAFWTVQAYCPAGEYSKVQKDIWNILSSVTV
jgi:hypothetical protein